MILEIADFKIHPGQHDEFKAAFEHGLAQIVCKSKGYIDHNVNQSIETPERYVLMIHWETLENHTVDFRESPAFAAWRAIVGPFFAAPPHVEHFTLLSKSA